MVDNQIIPEKIRDIKKQHKLICFFNEELQYFAAKIKIMLNTLLLDPNIGAFMWSTLATILLILIIFVIYKFFKKFK